MNVSGKRTSCAPLRRCFAATDASFSIVAVAVEGDRLDLHARDANRCVHRYRDDLVADGDLAVGEDVRVQARRGGRRPLITPGCVSALERRARLAQLDADALDVADAEALADELVQVDAAREDVAPALGRAELDAVLGGALRERLGRDQRDRATRRGASSK